MSSNDNFPDQPATPEARQSVRVGVDDWVAEADERRLQERPGLAGLLRRFVDAVPAPVRLALFVGFVATLPFWMDRGDLFSYGLFTLIYIILGLGLNVVVGYAGLLDLGYVAFFGFGAYFYGLLSSTHTDKGYTYDIHLPAQWSIPIVVVATALLGLLLGFTSRRLLGRLPGDRTLFFGQAFVAFVVATDWRGLTGGAERDRGHRPAQLLRLRADVEDAAVLLPADRLRARRDRALLRQRVAHGSRMACVA